MLPRQDDQPFPALNPPTWGPTPLPTTGAVSTGLPSLFMRPVAGGYCTVPLAHMPSQHAPWMRSTLGRQCSRFAVPLVSCLLWARGPSRLLANHSVCPHHLPHPTLTTPPGTRPGKNCQTAICTGPLCSTRTGPTAPQRPSRIRRARPPCPPAAVAREGRPVPLPEAQLLLSLSGCLERVAGKRVRSSATGMDIGSTAGWLHPRHGAGGVVACVLR